MNTEQLIQTLSLDVRPVPRHAVAKRITTGIAVGGLIAMLLVTVTLGVRLIAACIETRVFLSPHSPYKVVEESEEMLEP